MMSAPFWKGNSTFILFYC